MPALGGVICHLLFLPPWIFCTVLPMLATVLCLLSCTLGGLGSFIAQIAAASVCYEKPAFGLASTLASTAITYAVYATHDQLALYGCVIWTFMFWLNWGIHLPYSPAFSRWIFRLDMSSYYQRCELRGDLDSMGRSKTLYLFHPHGIVTVGFSTNGVWSREFNERTYPADGAPAAPSEPGWRGTVFLIAKALREPSVFFKLVCDVSGRLESATRQVICSRMREGRNLAIIPGGFEDATLYERGRHRTAMKGRKGLVKYALQHGYRIQPVYTFGENQTYFAFSGLLRLRLWINTFQLPAVAFFGDWRCPLFPRLSSECFSYVGPPLQLPTISSPSKEQVDEWHAKYLQALTVLFDKSKAEAGEPEATLEIW